jgi:hypothetical protein
LVQIALFHDVFLQYHVHLYLAVLIVGLQSATQFCCHIIEFSTGGFHSMFITHGNFKPDWWKRFFGDSCRATARHERLIKHQAIFANDYYLGTPKSLPAGQVSPRPGVPQQREPLQRKTRPPELARPTLVAGGAKTPTHPRPASSHSRAAMAAAAKQSNGVPPSAGLRTYSLTDRFRGGVDAVAHSVLDALSDSARDPFTSPIKSIQPTLPPTLQQDKDDKLYEDKRYKTSTPGKYKVGDKSHGGVVHSVSALADGKEQVIIRSPRGKGAKRPVEAGGEANKPAKVARSTKDKRTVVELSGEVVASEQGPVRRRRTGSKGA